MSRLSARHWCGQQKLDLIFKSSEAAARDRKAQDRVRQYWTLHLRRREGLLLFIPFGECQLVAELAGIPFLCVGLKAGFRSKIDTFRRVHQDRAPELTGTELSGKTVALIGLGHIAQQVAQILGVGFHCHLVGYDPYVSREKMATLDIEKQIV